MLGSSDCLVSTGHIGRDCRAIHYQLTVTLCLRPYSFMVLFGDLHGHVVPRLYAWLHFAPSACAAYSMVTTLQPQLHRGLQNTENMWSLNWMPKMSLGESPWSRWYQGGCSIQGPGGLIIHQYAEYQTAVFSTARGQFGRRSDLTCRKSVGKGGWVWPAVSRSAIAPDRLWHSTGE